MLASRIVSVRANRSGGREDSARSLMSAAFVGWSKDRLFSVQSLNLVLVESWCDVLNV